MTDSWSIFSYPNGTQLAVDWAITFLSLAGLPVTQPNIKFVYNWEVSEGGGAYYNPLNQGSVAGHPEWVFAEGRHGGGASDYVSWVAGLLGAVTYINYSNYAGVKAALQHSDYNAAAQALWASPWAFSHYGYGSAWNTSEPPSYHDSGYFKNVKDLGFTPTGSGQGTPNITNIPGEAGNAITDAAGKVGGWVWNHTGGAVQNAVQKHAADLFKGALPYIVILGGLIFGLFMLGNELKESSQGGQSSPQPSKKDEEEEEEGGTKEGEVSETEVAEAAA